MKFTIKKKIIILILGLFITLVPINLTDASCGMNVVSIYPWGHTCNNGHFYIDHYEDGGTVTSYWCTTGVIEWDEKRDEWSCSDGSELLFSCTHTIYQYMTCVSADMYLCGVVDDCGVLEIGGEIQPPLLPGGITMPGVFCSNTGNDTGNMRCNSSQAHICVPAYCAHNCSKDCSSDPWYGWLCSCSIGLCYCSQY